MFNVAQRVKTRILPKYARLCLVSLIDAASQPDWFARSRVRDAHLIWMPPCRIPPNLVSRNSTHRLPALAPLARLCGRAERHNDLTIAAG